MPPRAPHDGGGWLSYKERGNKLFAEGEHAQAKQHYVAAILECPHFSDMLHESSLVMSNKAAAWLNKVQGTEQISGKDIAETLVGSSGFVNDSPSVKRLSSLSDILGEGCISSCLSVLLNCGGNGKGWSRWARFLERQDRASDGIELLEAGAILLQSESDCEAAADLLRIRDAIQCCREILRRYLVLHPVALGRFLRLYLSFFRSHSCNFLLA